MDNPRLAGRMKQPQDTKTGAGARPRLPTWLLVLRVVALVAVATSAALYVDYVSHNPAFCSPNSGCSAVRASGFGYLFGGALPVPVLGIVGFAALFALSVTERPSLRRWVVPGAFGGAAVAAALIALQGLVIKQYCALCLVVDVAALAIGGAAYLHLRTTSAGTQPAREPLHAGSWIALGAIALVAPLVWPKVRPLPPVPPAIAAYYQPGKINVVEFADFQCPFCRMLHPLLKKLVAEYGERAHFVRLNMPLQSHLQAMGAAKAAVCGEDQGRKEQMADALFEAEDLGEAQLRRIAVSVGLDPQRFDACFADRKTQQRVQRESQILRDAGFQGLPTTYVGGRTLTGLRSEDVFREAFEAAARGGDESGIPGWMFLTFVAGAVVAAVRFGRRTSPTDAT